MESVDLLCLMATHTIQSNLCPLADKVWEMHFSPIYLKVPSILFSAMDMIYDLDQIILTYNF